MLKSLRAVGIACLLAYVAVSDANVVSWEIINLSFDDGASARGRFTFDTTLNTVTDFDILTTAAGSLATSFEYTRSTSRITQQANAPGGSGWPDVFFQIDSLDGVIPGATRELFLAFSQQLVLGGKASILYDGTLGRTSYERQSGGESAQAQRLVVGPGVVDPPAVPEPRPATYAAVGAAALILVSVWRRSKTRLIQRTHEM
jgi:hypothetical protein